MILNKKKLFFAASFILGVTFTGFAQEGRVQISQDTILPRLLELKTKMSKESRIGDRYKIQIYSGDVNEATSMIKEYRSLFTKWPANVEYETPNYKVWVGNFRNSVEADRALEEIKESFPAAFRFRPERNL